MPNFERRRASAALSVAAAFTATLTLSLLVASNNVWASFPDKPIRLIVPWAPGGSTDAIARALATRMSETMGKTIVVDNRPGAAGQIGTDAAAKAAPDGYTITLVELPHAIAPAVIAKLPYDLLRDFTPISMIGTSPLILFAGSASNNDLQDFKTFMRAASKGAQLAIAHSGNGTVSHLAGELLTSRSKVKFTMVPYRGSAPALTDVAAGIVSAHFATLASGAPLLTPGKVRALAVTSSQRLNTPALKDVPTLTELGIKGMEMNQWWAMVAPATTPIEIIEKLRAEMLAALAHPSVKDRLLALGIELQGSSRDQLRSFMRNETARWAEVAQGIGLQPQ
jgi:tripartite-type tricarboxylate transporter receptor subunit TctC